MILAVLMGCEPSDSSDQTLSGTEPSDAATLVAIDVKYYDATYDCWCETTEDRRADWWGPYAGPTTSDAGCNDNVWPTWATDDGRCVSILQQCGSVPPQDPWLDPCEDVEGCCALAYDHDTYPCEFLELTCGDDGRVVPP